MAAEGTALTAEDVFNSPEDGELVPVTIPEWKGKDGGPGKMWIRLLPADVSIRLSDELSADKTREAGDGIYLILIACAVDAEGKQIFGPEHLSLLKKKSMRVLNRLQKICLRHNAMLEEEPAGLEAAKKG